MNIQNSDIALIRMALAEDIAAGDITSTAIFSGSEQSSAYIIAKQNGVVCGVDVVKKVYELHDASVITEILLPDGTPVSSGDISIRIKGATKSILEGERTALNFFQRMSGIATKTFRIAEQLSGTKIKILDTRKTLPGFRMLDKYAVKTGGGQNHRIGLFDMVLIKDNHIKAAGSISAAVEKVRQMWNHTYTIEVETTCLEEVQEALDCKADIIMLDNMDIQAMTKACLTINKRTKIEISGNVNTESLKKLRTIDADFISMGALTHSVEAFDWSMKFDN